MNASTPERRLALLLVVLTAGAVATIGDTAVAATVTPMGLKTHPTTAIVVAPDGDVYSAGTASDGNQGVSRLGAGLGRYEDQVRIIADSRGASIAAMAVDPAGYVYVTGTTRSPSFPTTEGAFQPRMAGSLDNAFVAKLDLGLGDRYGGYLVARLVYSTYIGGTNNNWGNAITVDDAGYATVVGTTASRDFPTVNALQSISGGSQDAFVTKLAPDGRVIYSTYLGGAAYEEGRAVTVDTAGNAYLTGLTRSDNFPAGLASQYPHTCLTNHDCTDAFVAKLSPDGSMLEASTYLGGSDVDEGVGIKLDMLGRVYVGGSTSSFDFPVTTAQRVNGDQGCVGSRCPLETFVAVLEQSTLLLIASTYLPSAATDVAGNETFFQTERAISLDVDAHGTAYLLQQMENVQYAPYFRAIAWDPSRPLFCVTDPIRGTGNAISVETPRRLWYSASDNQTECDRGCVQTFGSAEVGDQQSGPYGFADVGNQQSQHSALTAWLADPNVQCQPADR